MTCSLSEGICCCSSQPIRVNALYNKHTEFQTSKAYCIFLFSKLFDVNFTPVSHWTVFCFRGSQHWPACSLIFKMSSDFWINCAADILINVRTSTQIWLHPLSRGVALAIKKNLLGLLQTFLLFASSLRPGISLEKTAASSSPSEHLRTSCSANNWIYVIHHSLSRPCLSSLAEVWPVTVPNQRQESGGKRWYLCILMMCFCRLLAEPSSPDIRPPLLLLLCSCVPQGGR